MSHIHPAKHQPPLPLDRLILNRPAGRDAIEMDVVFVGAGPAGLAGAIELARLAARDREAGGGLGELNIGVLEKAGSLGEHNLSGAVVNPIAFKELFPEVPVSEFPFRQPVNAESVYFLTGSRALPLPTPPTMHNSGYYTASICEIVRWLGERAEGLGVNLFTGYPAEALLVNEKTVRGIRTTPSGLNRDGSPGSAFTEKCMPRFSWSQWTSSSSCGTFCTSSITITFLSVLPRTTSKRRSGRALKLLNVSGFNKSIHNAL